MSKKQKLQLEDAQNQLADLTETLEREKVKLTPEVERYIEENVRKVQGKLQEGASVYPSDLVFIKKIEMWIELEGKFTLEQIDPKQFRELLSLAKEAKKGIDWIKENFIIEGNKIVCDGDLDLEECRGVTELPKGLKVGRSFYVMRCSGLRKLTAGLYVGGTLDLAGCTGLTELAAGLYVGGTLDLNGCMRLTELPEGLKVGSLHLKGCTGLIELPEELKVGNRLYLSDDLNEQVKIDAERLQKAGKIKEIKYV